MSEFFVQLAEKIDKILNWKFLSLCFFVSLLILFAIHIPIICNILEPMYTTIRIFLTLICLLSSAGIIYNCFAQIFSHYTDKIVQRKLERQAELEREKQNLEFENSMKSLINSLSPKEIAIIKFLLNEDGYMAWLPVENITVLSLFHKKCLSPIFNTSSVCGELFNHKSCFAYAISPDLLSYIKAHYDSLILQWDNIPKADMRIYQQQLE